MLQPKLKILKLHRGGFLVVGGAFNTGGPWGKLQPGVEEKVKQAPEMLSNCRQRNIWVKALSDANLGARVDGHVPGGTGGRVGLYDLSVADGCWKAKTR